MGKPIYTFYKDSDWINEKCIEYIYFDENNNVDYSTGEPDKYNRNQHCIVLSFENERDRTIVLNAMFTNDKRK